MSNLLKKPSAWIPIGMSICALLLTLGYIAVFGIQKQPQADEGVVARIFQLLLVGQVPIIALFLVGWLPQKPKAALKVLLVQFLAGFTAFTTVFFLEL